MTVDNLKDMYEVKKWSTIKISKELKCDDESVRKALKRYGIKIRSRSEAGKIKSISPEERERLKTHFAKLNLNKMGADHPSWKGGRYVDSYGYVTRRIDGRTIKEHRYVMEQHIGRKLFPWEEVNHINFDKQDNRIDNLEVYVNEHKRTDVIARKRQISSSKIIRLSPEQVKAYKKISGFKTTGSAEMQISSEEAWDLFEKLIKP